MIIPSSGQESTRNYLDRPIDMVHVSEHLGGAVIGEATDVQKRQFTEIANKRRAAILEMPSQEEGLNLDRVHAYRRELGIPAKEMRLLAPEQFARATDAKSDEHTDDGGFYSPTLDLIVVNRDPVLEELNGPGYTESIAVHEIVHSNTEAPRIEVVQRTIGRFMCKKTVIKFQRPRSGYVEKTQEGDRLFIEEALADYERGQYVKNVLGRPGGFVAPPGEDFDRTGTIPIPGHYWYMSKEADGSIRPSFTDKSAIAAATLEILIEQDPEILPLLRAGRTIPEGSSVVAERMNALKPGLYDQLNNAMIDKADGDMKALEVFMGVYDEFVNNGQ